MGAATQGTLSRWATGHNAGDLAKYHRVERTAERDLSFTGWKVGSGKFGYPGDDENTWERGRNIDIYVTAAGRIVVAVERWSIRPGEGVLYSAGVFESPDAAVAFLLEEGKGRLGHASKTAWEEACRTCEALRDEETETIE